MRFHLLQQRASVRPATPVVQCHPVRRQELLLLRLLQLDKVLLWPSRRETFYLTE
jgi:hypothetical protein